MKKSNLSRVFDRVAGDHIPEDRNLLPGILSRIEKERQTTMTPLLKFALAALLIIALIAAGILAIPGTVTAMQRMLGFLPGAGVIDTSAPIRVLAEPVSHTRDGITVTVGAAILSADKTVVTFTVDNVPWSALSHDERIAGCGLGATLRLPNGSVLELITGEGSASITSFVYPPVAAEISEAVFVMPCIQGTLPGKAPENWELPLRFTPAAQITPAPVVDLPATAQPTAAAPIAENPTLTPQPDTAFLGIQLHLDRYIPLEDGYYLIGHTTWADERIRELGWMGWNMKAFDAAGQELALDPEMGLPASISLGEEASQPGRWIYRLYGRNFLGPVTLRVFAIDVRFNTPIDFTLDLGRSDLQPDADYEIDSIPLTVLDLPAQVTGVTYQQVSDLKGFEFHGQVAPPLRSLYLQIPFINSIGGGANAAEQRGEFNATAISDQPVSFPLLVSIISAQVEGTWSVRWDPPAGDPAAPVITIQKACLTLEDWKDAVKNPPALPNGLPTQVLLSRGALAPDPSLFLANLDGSAEQGLVFGGGSLTADGQKLVYSGSEDEFTILDLSTNQRTPLKVTAQDYRPIWSPDGQKIAFSRFGDDEGIYVMNSDGTDLHQVVGTGTGENRPELFGWSPDSKELLYSALLPERGESALRMADATTGAVRDLFTIRNAGPAAIAPDGQWIAYIDHVPGKMGYGLYISQLDGAERRLLVQLEHWGVGDPVWSPDGQWMAISVINSDEFLPDSTAALVNVQTCQVIPLLQLKERIQSWVKP